MNDSEPCQELDPDICVECYGDCYTCPAIERFRQERIKARRAMAEAQVKDEVLEAKRILESMFGYWGVTR